MVPLELCYLIFFRVPYHLLLISQHGEKNKTVYRYDGIG